MSQTFLVGISRSHDSTCIAVIDKKIRLEILHLYLFVPAANLAKEISSKERSNVSEHTRNVPAITYSEPPSNFTLGSSFPFCHSSSFLRDRFARPTRWSAGSAQSIMLDDLVGREGYKAVRARLCVSRAACILRQMKRYDKTEKRTPG